MIKPSFTFNGIVEVKLLGDNSDDKQLLELVFNGREVKSIKPAADGGVILEMVKSEGRKPIPSAAEPNSSSPRDGHLGTTRE